MNIIQSFSSKKCDDEFLFMQICYFTLSCLYADESGIDLTLHTDSRFAEFIHAPYKNIKITMDDVSDIHKLIWAYPKFIALDMEPVGTIHIDGDVFLKDKSIIKYLDFSDYDCIVQSLEIDGKTANMGSYKSTYEGIKHLEYPSFIENQVPKVAINNGILGINNETLGNLYRDTYGKMVNQFTDRSSNYNNGCVPDIIFEQEFLYQIVQKFGYKMKFLLNGQSVEELNNLAASIHYQHVCSDKRKRLSSCLKLIKKKDSKIFNQIKLNGFEQFPEYFLDN